MIKVLANAADFTDIYCVQMRIGHYQVQIPPFLMHMDAETACQGQRSACLCLALYPKSPPRYGTCFCERGGRSPRGTRAERPNPFPS